MSLQRLKFIIANSFFAVWGRLPLWLLHGVGAALGALLFLLPIKARYYARRNLELCFPQTSFFARQWLLLRALCEVGKSLTEAPVFWVRPQAQLLRLVRNHEAFLPVRASVAAGKGAIVLGLHLGGFYLKNAFMAHYLPDTTYLYKPQKGVLGTIMETRMGRYGGHLVTTSKEGVLALFRHLKKGGCVGLICDHNVLDYGNAWVPFFGHRVPTTTLAAKLAHKTQAPVFMAVMERLSWGRGFRLHVWPLDAAIYDADENIGVGAMNHAIEQAIRRFPTQHEWLYRRFWDRPAGEPKLYKTQN